MESARTEMVRRPLFWFVLLLVNVTVICWLYTSVHYKVDYEAFYSAGRAFLSNPHHLYDPSVQIHAAGIWEHKDEYLPYYHLPTELPIFAPLSLIPYRWSLAVWRLVSCGVLLYAAFFISKTIGLPFRFTSVVFAGFVPVLLCVGEGQDSILLLLLVALSYRLSSEKKDIAGGAVLALGLFKPQVTLVVALALLVSGKKRFFASFATSGIVLAGAISFYLGNGWVRDLLRLMRWQELRETPSRMVSLHGLLSRLQQADSQLLEAVLMVLLIGYCVPFWRRCGDLGRIFGSAVLAGSLAAYHFHIYDTTLFLLPLAILYRHGASELDCFAAIPFFVSPLLVFLMANQFTSALTIAAIIWLTSYWKLMKAPEREAQQQV